MRLADALIAATAIEHGLTLLTANLKHFGAVGDLHIEAFAPYATGNIACVLRDALIDLSGTVTGLALRSLWLARLRQPQTA